jgi:hypothetical protein
MKIKGRRSTMTKPIQVSRIDAFQQHKQTDTQDREDNIFMSKIMTHMVHIPFSKNKQSQLEEELS